MGGLIFFVLFWPFMAFLAWWQNTDRDRYGECGVCTQMKWLRYKTPHSPRFHQYYHCEECERRTIKGVK